MPIPLDWSPADLIHLALALDARISRLTRPAAWYADSTVLQEVEAMEAARLAIRVHLVELKITTWLEAERRQRGEAA